ncbi:MAG: glycosyltransferase [Verrucomicrobiota bacterium]
MAPSRSAPPLSPSLDLPPSLIEPILDRHQVQSWFKYVYRERASRWDVWQPCFWLAQHTPREAKILSVGTGVGFNLLWLGRQGFTKLEGFDLDAKAVGAAVDLAAAAGVQARYWVDDGLNPTGLRGRKYDVVECLNWTHLLPNFSLSSLIESYLPYLVDEGVFIIDVIDRAYDQVPGNQWHTADANKPEHERRPTEYLTRMNQAEVSAAFRAKGFKVVARLAEPQKIPKAVYVARRLSATISGADGASAQTSPDKQAQASAAKARVLLIADVPNWIFERHARTLHALLAHQFDFTLGFQGQKFNEDDFDLIYPLEWNLVPAEQIRTPRKWVTGIRSHCAWQPIGLEPVAALLVQKFQRVHAVSRRLQHLFAPRVSGVELLSHGVDTEFFSSRTPADLSGAGKLRLGWAGNRRSGSRKGFEEIIEPLGRIPGVELVFCGYSDRLLTANEMVDFYNSIDAYVCASDFEGNNNSLLEAASMARAIITTDSGTVSEYLRHGESALIVDRRPEAFARAVRQLRDNPSLRLQLGSAASQAVQAFAWRTQATRHADFFRRALTVATQAPVQRHDNAAWLGAEQAARSALQNHPEDVEALRSLAGALFQQAKWVECAQTCHRLLTLQTDDIDVLVVLAEALNQGGDSPPPRRLCGESWNCSRTTRRRRSACRLSAKGCGSAGTGPDPGSGGRDLRWHEGAGRRRFGERAGAL